MARKTRQKTTSVSMIGSASRQPEFDPDYTYITRDLRRVGVLAGSFFVLLIVLSFFIR